MSVRDISFRNAHMFAVRKFWEILFAILAECSQFCLGSFEYKCKRKSIASLGLGKKRGIKNERISQLITLMITERRCRLKVLNMYIHIPQPTIMFPSSSSSSSSSTIDHQHQHPLGWCGSSNITSANSIFQLHCRSFITQMHLHQTRTDINTNHNSATNNNHSKKWGNATDINMIYQTFPDVPKEVVQQHHVRSQLSFHRNPKRGLFWGGLGSFAQRS